MTWGRRVDESRTRYTRSIIVNVIKSRLVNWNPPDWVLQDLISFAHESHLDAPRAALLLHVPRQWSARDMRSINRTFSGMTKLIFPAGVMEKEEARLVLELAIELRLRVLVQLHAMSGQEFHTTELSYIDRESGEGRVIGRGRLFEGDMLYSSSSIAPKDLRVDFWVSVKPFVCVMFIRSYGLSLLNVFRSVPTCQSQRLIVPS